MIIVSRSNSGLLWFVAMLLLGGLLAWLSYQSRHAMDHGVKFTHGLLQIQRAADNSVAAFKVEIALTPQQQEYGLMYRKSLAPDAGMLFMWGREQNISMWMKNTLIPLDMLFVRKDGQITKIAANAQPEDLTSIPSEGPVRAVIEIGGGEAARQNIKAGDRVIAPTFAGL